MELRVLRCFLVIAREENITRASELLHISQPALSRQIMQLEDELGVKLFRRSKHSIILTEEGVLLKRRAQELIDLAEKTEKEFHQGAEISGEITIGSGEYHSSLLLAELIKEFHEAHPLVSFSIYSGNSDNIKERIERGILDFGLLLEPVETRKYEFIRFPFPEEWGVYVNEESDLAGKPYVRNDDLAALPIICTQREIVQNELASWLGRYRDQLNIPAMGNLPYNMAALARSGLGVHISLKLDLKYDGVSFLPLNPPLYSNTIMAYKKGQPLSRASQSFIEYAKEAINSISRQQ